MNARLTRSSGSGANRGEQGAVKGWANVSDLSSIEGQIQVFTCAHRNFFTDVMAQALRHAGQGMAVLIVQFYKGGIGQGPEHPNHLSQNLDWVRCRLTHSINAAPEQPQEREAILELWTFVQEAIEGGRYEQVILEELSLAVAHGIVPEAEVLELLEHRPCHVDVVLLGQQMPESLIGLADQVTKLRNVFNIRLDGPLVHSASTQPAVTQPAVTRPAIAPTDTVVQSSVAQLSGEVLSGEVLSGEVLVSGDVTADVLGDIPGGGDREEPASESRHSVPPSSVASSPSVEHPHCHTEIAVVPGQLVIPGLG